MTTSTPNTETTDEFAERTLWRDALDALLSLVGRGQDVDPVELSETRARAEAEAEVETGRLSAHARKKAEKARVAAEAEADRIAAEIDPNIRDAVEAEIAAAHTAYLDSIDAAVEKYSANAEQVAALAAVVRRTGVPVVDGSTQANRTTRVDGDRVVTSPGGRNVPTWRGVSYGVPSVEGDKLPHRKDSPRLKAINALRGRRT